jgi:hypothetical protein
VSQATANLATKQDVEDVEARLSARMDGMDRRFDEVDKRFDQQNEQLDEIQNAVGAELEGTDTKLKDYGIRLQRLEQKSA